MLTEKQRLAVTHLACGLSGKETALLIGVTANTLSVWRQSPRFRQEIAREQHLALAELRSQLLLASRTALNALVEIAGSGESEDSRVAASKSILNHSRLIPSGNDLGLEMGLAVEPEPDPLLLDLADLLARHWEGWEPQDLFLDFLAEEGILDDPEGVEAVLTDEVFRHSLMAKFRAESLRLPAE